MEEVIAENPQNAQDFRLQYGRTARAQLP